jgi:tetratricopeptide (TPR) repeat protein
VAGETVATALDEGASDESVPEHDDSIGPDGSGVFGSGQRIDRYLVISKLGAGAMGVVLAAWDPKLDRKVALKLLADRGGGSSSARERLQREAQALAKLGHPNVVGVFDVGAHEDLLFVAMEFVAGQTLGAWMRSVDSPRPWKEVLAVFMPAGRGLAAAHGAGLIHRDFKPDNVMLGDDGRTRVMDFGLARALGDDAVGERLEGSSAPIDRLTRTGAMMGTPAYMPLEQFRGQGVDARSDQFSFCVALYEALYGERPFAGATVAALLAVLGEERIRKPPANASVPTWLREVVVRGLARDPDRRWPSMQALLDALANDPVPRRRRRLAAGVLVATLAGGGWWVNDALQADARFCKHAEDKLVGVWDEDRRAALEQAILATNLSYAPETWERVEENLDAYAEAWVVAREQACEATHQGEQSGELLDLRMACLDEQRSHLHATVDELTRVDATVLPKAIQIVLALPELERCADVEALRAEVPPPEDPAVAEEVAVLDERLIDAKVKEGTGRYEKAATLVDSVVTEGATLGYEPLMARAWLRQGSLQNKQGQYDDAVATLRRSLDAALAVGMPIEAADAATMLVGIVGSVQKKHDEAQRWVELSDPLVRAAGTDGIRANWLNSLGILAESAGNFDEAHDHHQQALAIREQALGPNHASVAISLNNLGVIAQATGKFEDARAYHQRALAIREQALGPNHPAVANTLNNLGNAAQAEGKFADARSHYERALAISEKALGPDHPDLAGPLNNLGTAAQSEGKLEDARKYLERALAIREKALGPEHPRLALTIHNLGNVAISEGKLEDARDYYERALTIREQALGVDHPEVGTTLYSLGTLARTEGKLESAREYFERALAIEEKTLGVDHPDVAPTLTGLGNLALAEGKLEDARERYERALAIQEKALGVDHPDIVFAAVGLGITSFELGKPTEAIPHLERALALRTTHPGDAVELAEIRFALAEALWDAPVEAGRDRARARELASLARTASASAEGGERSAKQLTDITTWLTEHPE